MNKYYTRLYNREFESGKTENDYTGWLEERLEKETNSRREWMSRVEELEQLLLENGIEFDCDE